ncbi:MAG: DUF5679 domain-containing protein [Patescibacteria group bacterium]
MKQDDSQPVTLIGHCMKCKQKREMKNVDMVEIKPGRPAAKGKCSVCDTGMYKIMSKEQAEEYKKAA